MLTNEGFTIINSIYTNNIINLFAIRKTSL